MWGFSWRITLLSHLLNMFLSRRDCSLFQGIPRDSLVGSLERGQLVGKYMRETSSTLLGHLTNKVSHALPVPFFYVDTSLVIVLDYMS